MIFQMRREVNGSHFTNANLTFQIGTFDSEDYYGNIKNGIIWTWKEEIGQILILHLDS